MSKLTKKTILQVIPDHHHLPDLTNRYITNLLNLQYPGSPLTLTMLASLILFATLAVTSPLAARGVTRTGLCGAPSDASLGIAPILMATDASDSSAAGPVCAFDATVSCWPPKGGVTLDV